MRQRDGTMRSSVNWALLGLVIERPSYGYELTQRFERIYGGLLNLQGPSQIYMGLDSLMGRGYIEEMENPTHNSSKSRQPRPYYRATRTGVRCYLDRPLMRVGEELRDARVLVYEVAGLPPQTALSVIDRYEKLLHDELEGLISHTSRDHGYGGGSTLAERLAAQDECIAIKGKLLWVQCARREFSTVLEARVRAGERRQGLPEEAPDSDSSA